MYWLPSIGGLLINTRTKSFLCDVSVVKWRASVVISNDYLCWLIEWSEAVIVFSSLSSQYKIFSSLEKGQWPSSTRILPATMFHLKIHSMQPFIVKKSFHSSPRRNWLVFVVQWSMWVVDIANIQVYQDYNIPTLGCHL